MTLCALCLNSRIHEANHGTIDSFICNSYTLYLGSFMKALGAV